MNKVHHSYLEYPSDDWLMSNNSGNCYKEHDTRQMLVQYVRCLDCETKDKWFRTQVAYAQHWDSVHRRY